MFNKQNFCHIASNNRNDVKVGVFVYKTTDDLQTVLTSGYFNEKIVDINLHDLIIHEQTNVADKTIVERNLLCVTERTLENVGTQLIQSNWEKTTDQTIADIEAEIESLDDTFVHKAGDTMTGSLRMEGSRLQFTTTGASDGIQIRPTVAGINFSTIISLKELFTVSANAVYPTVVGGQTISLGTSDAKWNGVFTTKINNGGDLEVPAVSGTIATKADVDLAANSGDQLTDKGVWYAKMYAATVAPSAEDGTNYADFSQTDTGGNPIIVLYERQNGAWVQTDTITPPADYNGYVTVTSKIWDIVEQAGQQGGKVLWAHNTKTFTPYPQIISFDGANITNGAFQGSADLSGTSTVAMPVSPSSTQIVNKDYVDTAIAAIPSGAFDLFDFKWRDSTTSNTAWALSDGNWKTNTTAYQHLADDIDGKTLQSETIGSTTIQFYLADDGHKICPASEESNVSAIYTATGVAWYYVVDTENQQFMLPRVSADTQVIKTEVPVDITSNGKAFVFTNGSSTYTFASNASAGFTGGANANTAIGAGVSPANNGARATGYHSGLSATADLTSATGLYAGHKYLYFYVGA